MPNGSFEWIATDTSPDTLPSSFARKKLTDGELKEVVLFGVMYARHGVTKGAMTAMRRPNAKVLGDLV